MDYRTSRRKLDMLIPMLIGMFIVFFGTLVVLWPIISPWQRQQAVLMSGSTPTPLQPVENTPTPRTARLSGTQFDPTAVISTPYPTATPVWKEMRTVNLIDPKMVTGVKVKADIETIVSGIAQIVYINHSTSETNSSSETSADSALPNYGGPLVADSSVNETRVEIVAEEQEIEIPYAGSRSELFSPCSSAAGIYEADYFGSWGNASFKRGFVHLGVDLACYSYDIVAPGNTVVTAVINRNLTENDDTYFKYLRDNGWIDAASDPAQYYGGSGICVITTSMLDEGQIYMLFCHFARGTVNVQVGQVLSQGEHIGTMGSTGISWGDHVHYEVFSVNNDGSRNYLDPVLFNAETQKP